MFLSHIAAALRKRRVSCAALAWCRVQLGTGDRTMQMSPVASRFLQASSLPLYGPIHSHLAPVLRVPFPLRESTAARAIGSACRCDGQAKSLSLVACSGGIQEGHSIVVNEVREFKVPTVRARA